MSVLKIGYILKISSKKANKDLKYATPWNRSISKTLCRIDSSVESRNRGQKVLTDHLYFFS